MQISHCSCKFLCLALLILVKMADLRDEYGNPIQLTDEQGCPVQLTDEYGNPVHITGIATKQAPEAVTVTHTDVPDTGVFSSVDIQGDAQECKTGEGGDEREQKEETKDESSGEIHRSSSSSSSSVRYDITYSSTTVVALIHTRLHPPCHAFFWQHSIQLPPNAAFNPRWSL